MGLSVGLLGREGRGGGEGGGVRCFVRALFVLKKRGAAVRGWLKHLHGKRTGD